MNSTSLAGHMNSTSLAGHMNSTSLAGHMNSTEYVIVLFIVIIIITDATEDANADRYVAKPGERWLYVGKTLTIKCKMNTPTLRNVCNSTRKKEIVQFNLPPEYNTTSNRLFIHRSMTVTCTRYVVMKLRNITADVSGVYWCGKFNKTYIVDVKVVDRVTKPKNISCIFHGKKTLNCTYRVYDNSGYNKYSCYAGKRERGRFNNLSNNQCPKDTTNMQLTDENGQCNYTCKERDDCNANILLIIKGINKKGNKTVCRIKKLRELVKPGPVRELRVTNKSTTTLSVQWFKPDDYENSRDIYHYTVRWSLENGSGAINKTLTSENESLFPVISNLKAGQTYTVTVTANPERLGFTSEPSIIHNTTKETYPACGPLVPEGSFSVQNMTSLAVYWQKIPEEQRGGRIIEYDIMYRNDTITVPPDQLWSSLKVPGTKDQIAVILKAATKMGYSAKHTTLHVSRAMLRSQSVTEVHRQNDTVVWQHSGIVADRWRVHRCYGRQKQHQQQLVECRTEIEYKDMNNTSKRQYQWPDPEAPTLSCERCQWHYAVSVHNNKTTAGMVWNTGSNHQLSSRVKSTRSHEDGLGVPKILYFVILPLVGFLILAFGIVTYMLIQKKLTCKTYIIKLPTDWERMFESLTSSEDNVENVSPRTEETSPQPLQDTSVDSEVRISQTRSGHDNEEPAHSEIPLVTVSLDNSLQVDAVIHACEEQETTADVHNENSDCFGGESGDDDSVVSDYRMLPDPDEGNEPKGTYQSEDLKDNMVYCKYGDILQQSSEQDTNAFSYLSTSPHSHNNPLVSSYSSIGGYGVWS